MVAQRPLEVGICDLVEDDAALKSKEGNAAMFFIGLRFPVFRR